jgi:phosphoserine phosphatase
MSTTVSDAHLKIWKGANAVCFDVDSTVCQDEGIDELAAYCGSGDEVAAWTAKAMGGDVPFEVALAARLEIIKPSRDDFANCLVSHPPALTEGVAELFATLQANNVDVYLVSGGFRLMIEPVADLLDIPHSRIYANTVFFNDDGTYKDFDADEYTSKAGGKPAVVELLKETHGYEKVVMVGDGATDMDARPPADLFIGFGGIVVRDSVKAGADWFVTDFQDMIEPIRQ